MQSQYSKKHFLTEENKKIILVPLQIIAGLVVTAGSIAMMFEVKYFADFSFGIYFGRLIATLIGFTVLVLVNFEFGKNHPVLLIHLLLLTIISSFASIIYQLPQTLYINSHLLALVIFTSALFLNWELKHQIIVAIYYNIIFASSVLLSNKTIYFLPSMFASVLFVILISVMSIIASAINYRLRLKTIQKNFEAKIILDNSTEAIFMANKTGEVQKINWAFQNIFGFASINNLNLENIFSNQDEYKEFKLRLDEKRFVNDFIIKKIINSDERILSLNAKLFDDLENSDEQIIGSIQDVTERILAEEKIKKYNEELSLLNQSKDKFFSILAHDLLSPFSVLMGYSEILASQTETLSKEEIKEFSGYVYNISKNSLNLLNELLDWSRLQTNRLEFNPIKLNLRKIVSDIVNLYREAADKKNISINNLISDDFYVHADNYMMNTIVRNLVSNAIKFTSNYGNIIINARMLGKQVEFSVKDTGIGIKEEILKDLFKIEKLHTTKGTNEERGNGLGLILCKELIEKNNGSIKVESKYGEGSTFHVMLPSA